MLPTILTEVPKSKSPEIIYQEIQDWLENAPIDMPPAQLNIALDIIKSGIFKNCRFEGKRGLIPQFKAFLMSLTHWLAHSTSPEYFKEQVIEPIFSSLTEAYKKATAFGILMGMKKNKLDKLNTQLEEMKQDAFNRLPDYVRNYNPIDTLIILFYLPKITVSDRAVSRCIHTILTLPGINRPMVTEEGIRKRIANLREQNYLD